MAHTSGNEERHIGHLVPRFIQDRFEQRIYSGAFRAAALFADISGFTRLTDMLMHYRREGAEELTRALNYVFHPLIAQVYAHGGFVATFSGDGFTALFPSSHEACEGDRALHVALAIRDFFAQQGVMQTRYGSFEMEVKAGLAHGLVKWGILGDKGQHVYFFRGPTVDACVQAERHAQTGDVVASADLLSHIEADVETAPVLDASSFLRITSRRIAEPRSPLPRDLSPEKPTPFVPDIVAEFVRSDASAEFREVATVFISLDAPPEGDAWNAFVATVIDLAAEYGGYLNKLDFGDKGAVMLLLFGAPLAHETDLARAANFILALKARDNAIDWRAGLTSGMVYAGIIGGAERCEYTAIGDVVNLSARLVQRAPWGEIWLGAIAAESLQQLYEVEPVGEFTMKGTNEALAVYRLRGQRLRAESTPHREMVGRTRELGQLIQFVQPIRSGRCAGLAYVYGEAGAGKSRLVYELHQHLTRRPEAPDVRWLMCPADEILRQSLNPFKRCLRQYFSQSPDRSTEENRTQFTEILDALIADVQKLGAQGESRAMPLAEELERTRSFLGALVDLHWSDSLYETLDPRLRFENTLLAFRALIQAESLRQPIVLQLEDLHWLDTDSPEMIRILTQNAAAYPIAIICTGRYRDDGSRVTLPVAENIRHQMIDLGMLSPEDIQTFTGHVLGAEDTPVEEGLEAFLIEKTGGNPFFVEQLLLDLREREALEQVAGIWRMHASDALHVPTTISAVLIARLDRLMMQVRHIVQTAAVLGQEFQVRVLSQMLEGEAWVTEGVREAEEADIWAPLSEIRYIFRHALLRDAAYDMQMRTRLRTLHRLAGNAIEQVYAGHLPPHYADLAYHYGQAEDDERERHYTRLAGEQAAARFANDRAEAFFTRTLELTPEADTLERYELFRAREKVYDLQGQREGQGHDLDAMERLARSIREHAQPAAVRDAIKRQAEAALRRANYAYVTSAYETAARAARSSVEWAHSVQEVGREAEGHLQYGQALARLGEGEAAWTHFEQALSLARAASERLVEADSLLQFGMVALFLRGEYTEAKFHLKKALQIHRQIHHRAGEGASLGYLGIAFSREGNYPEARSYYEQALRIFREIGDRYGQGPALNNLGHICAEHGEYAEAISYFEQDMRNALDIGEYAGTGMTHCNLGIVRQRLGDYGQAEAHYEKAVAIAREVGDPRRESETLVYRSLLAHQLGDDPSAAQYAEQALDITQNIGARDVEAYALTYLGHAVSGLGCCPIVSSAPTEGATPENLVRAAEAYEHAIDIRRELGQFNFAMESLAGLAYVLLAQGEASQALSVVEEIQSHLDVHPMLDGTEEPFRVYLTCYCVLRANNNIRARELLATAYALLQERAAGISDETLHRLFLDKVCHRELIRAWECQ